MPDILGVEIFAVGTWVGSMGPTKWTEDDMDLLVTNTKMLMNGDEFKISPKLKIGHDNEQFWETAVIDGQYDGDPSLGQITNFRTRGSGKEKKVVCDFLDVPQIIYDVIAAKLYTNVSAEIDFSRGVGWFISAVALLGADIPAVKKLEDLQAFLSERVETRQVVSNSIVFSVSKPNIKGVKQMPDLNTNGNEPAASNASTTQSVQPDPAISQLLETNDQLRTNYSEKEKEIARMRAEKAAQDAELQKFRQQAVEAKFTQQKEKILAPYKQDVDAKKLLPAVYDKIVTCLDGQKAAFTEESQLLLTPDLAREVAQAYTENVPGSESGMGSGALANPGNDGAQNAPDVVLAKECKILMDQHKMTYSQATSHLQLTKPKLFEEYYAWTEKVSNLGKHNPVA